MKAILKSALTVLSIASVGAASAKSAIYIEGNAGVGFQNWQSGYNDTTYRNKVNPVNVFNSWKNQRVTFGADVGYQFLNHLAFEVGYFRLPSSTAAVNPTAQAQIPLSGDSVTFKGSLYYAALKGNFSLSQQASLFMKAGVGKQQISSSKVLNEYNKYYQTSQASHLTPLFAVGLNYHLQNNLTLGAQYLYAQGATKNLYLNGSTYIIPNLQLVTLSLGYSFSM